MFTQSNIIDPNLLKIPTFSVRLIQIHRVFDLIQQNIQSPKPVFNVHHLENFMNRFHPYIFTSTMKNNLSKIMQKLNKQGDQLNQQNFSFNLAKHTKQLILSGDQSMKYFYKELRDFFMCKFQKPTQIFQRWDYTITEEQLKSKEWIQIRFKQVMDFHDKLKPYIDGMQIYAFQNALEQINYCLSICMLPLNQLLIDDRQMTQKQYEEVQQKMLAICSTFINQNVMQYISQFINYLRPFVMGNQSNINPYGQMYQNTQNIVRYLKCMSYFYTLCKYPQIKQKLQTFLCMTSHETFVILIASLTIPIDSIRNQIAICLSLISKYDYNFIDWLLSDVQGRFVPLLQNVAGLSDQQGLYHALICLKKILKKYQTKSKQFQNNQTNLGVIAKIHTFTLMVLKISEKMIIQQQCILIVSEILKICPLNFSQIQQLKITTKVFQVSEEIQQILIPPTLNLLQTSIITKNEDLINIMIKDVSFLKGLINNISNKNSPYFYEFLHIVYLLSFDNLSYLIDKGILQMVITMMFQIQNNPTIISLGTDIIYNIVQKILQRQENDSLLQLLYNKFALFERIIPYLFKKCFQKNEYGDIFMTTIDQKNNIFVPAYNYFDKRLFMTIFRILYCLAIGVSRRHKRYAFSRRVNQQIVTSLTNILRDLFRSQNRQLIQLILTQKLKIQNNRKWNQMFKINHKSSNGIQLFKLIDLILNEMTHNTERKSLQFLKNVNCLIKSYSRELLLSQFFTLHQLQVQGIPIYLIVEFDIKQKKFKRQIPHKYELSSLKNYIKSLVSRQGQIKQNEIKDVIIAHPQTKRLIENQVQYRTLVNKQIEKKKLQIPLEIIDIKYKHRRQDPINVNSFIGGPILNRSQNLTNSFVGRQSRSRVIPNSRFTNLQHEPSPVDPRRTYHTPTNFNYSNYNRSNSPIFGGQTGGLGRTTRN